MIELIFRSGRSQAPSINLVLSMDAVRLGEVRILLHIVFAQLKIGDLQQTANRVDQVARSQVSKAPAPALLSSADLMIACAVGAPHYLLISM
jgi:hypothetical protein